MFWLGFVALLVEIFGFRMVSGFLPSSQPLTGMAQQKDKLNLWSFCWGVGVFYMFYACFQSLDGVLLIQMCGWCLGLVVWGGNLQVLQMAVARLQLLGAKLGS